MIAHHGIYWFGYAAAAITMAASVFIAVLLWRREHIPNSAYWAFAILIGFPALLFVLQEIEIPTPWGPFSYAARSELTDIKARLGKIEASTAPREKPHWTLLREGDCGDRDISSTPGPTPDDAKCTSQDISAVCWDNQLYRNGTTAWCTYKSIPPDQCVGGASPGRIFQCNIPKS